MKAIALVLIGLVLNVYALNTMVSTIIWEQPIITPNCGKATKFALFGYTAPLTGEYIFDTKLTTDCEDTVLIFGADKSCNNDISRSNLKSKLKVRLVAGILYQFYVGGYKDSCAKGTSVYLSSELVITTLPPTATPTVPPISRVLPYKIEFEFSETVKSKYKPIFINAAARWQRIITRDLPLVVSVSNWKMTKCFGFDPKYPLFQRRKIEDILIGVNVKPLNGSLGGATYCLRDQAGFPRLAMMEINSVDVDAVMNEGDLENLIMHEIGHTLGIGRGWADNGLISRGTERYCEYCYIGTNGNIGNELIGRPAGQKAIIEDEGRPGNVGGHWKESVYTSELMTGTLGPDQIMPISALTVYSLKDLGYTVDVSKAEPFTVSSGRRLREEKKRKFDFEATLVRPKVEFVHGFPKPGREKEVEDLIIKNAEQVKHLIDSIRG